MRAHRADDHGRITPSSSDAGARAERSLLDVFLWMRVAHLAAGLVSLTVDRRRYRRPGVADVAFVVALLESAWLAQRCRREGAYADPVVTTVDAVVGCAGLVACAGALAPDDQFGASNWMFPLTLFSSIAASAGFSQRRKSAAVAGALMGTYALVTSARSSGRRRQSMFGAFQYAGCFVGGDILIRRTRANAVEIERAAHEAVERALRVARERERTRAHTELHAGALEALESVRAHWWTDRQRAQAVARREAIRLRRALRDERVEEAPDFVRRLEEVVRDLAEADLRVDLVLDELDRQPPPEPAAAVADALRAALRNVVEHAGVNVAVVRAVATDDAVDVIVRDQGHGCAIDEAPPSVVAPVRRVGGEVEWWSRPGRGARVCIRVAS